MIKYNIITIKIEEQSPVTSIPIEQTRLTKHSNKTVTDVCELEQNWDISSKILSKIGQKK